MMRSRRTCRVFFASLLSLYLLATAVAQMDGNNGPDLSGFDPDLIDYPDESIDFAGCFLDLANSDLNGDGFIKKDEYLGFIQEYGKRICFTTDRLTLQQVGAFNSLACICESQEGSAPDCCLNDNARIQTTGALTSSRTVTQLQYLVSVCRITDATMEFRCTPSPRVIETLPPFFVVPNNSFEDNDGVKSWWVYVAAILAILLLLLLLCCCCCWAIFVGDPDKEERVTTEGVEEGVAEKVTREVRVHEEPETDLSSLPNDGPDEEEALPIPDEVETQQRTMEEIEEEQTLEDESKVDEVSQYMEEEEDEEGKKRRGGGNLPAEDEEANRRIGGAGRLPPPEDPDPNKLALKPVLPREDDSDPEWDQPGRNIDFAKSSDEYSAGEVDHYTPDGGVNIPTRPTKKPVEFNNNWERGEKDDPDEDDTRKHRIQSGLGEGEVWDKLNEREDSFHQPKGGGNDAFDWVVQSALGVLGTTDADAPASDEEGSMAFDKAKNEDKDKADDEDKPDGDNQAKNEEDKDKTDDKDKPDGDNQDKGDGDELV